MPFHNGYSSNFLEYYMVIHLHLENSILFSTLWDKRIWQKWKMWYQFLKIIVIWKNLSFETKIVKENTQFSEMVLICFKKQQYQQVLPTSCSFVIKGFFFQKFEEIQISSMWISSSFLTLKTLTTLCSVSTNIYKLFIL